MDPESRILELQKENELLREKIKQLELQKENEALQQRIASLESELTEKTIQPFETVASLTNPDIRRFGRQLILPKWGKDSQLKLRNSSILIVGAGGLGAPAALYLGAGGVGRLGIVDHDDVDISNLHRQVIHTEAKQGMKKAISAMKAIHAINSSCHVVPYTMSIDSSNALDVIQQYDLVVDATDNVATRYLLNDACVLLKKPLVSGSALRYDGQLTVYNYQNGPCYRCLHPVPPPPETVGRCSDNGVLGVVPGVIGILQALEAMKVVTGLHPGESSFLIFSALSNPMFRTMKLRNKKKDCQICGEHPTITQLIDYVAFCGTGADDKNISQSILGPDQRITATEYQKILEQDQSHVLLDVRPTLQLDICQLPHSLNIPIDELDKRMDELVNVMKQQSLEGKDVFVVCRLGNDSQLAVKMLEKHDIQGARDITGGYYQWAVDVDSEFPIY
ncbi:Molybdopterin-synthase sulfurtransferase [Halteromyces radiatus]|uniref:Molybdopterin-synthase sulfurtransferase n=1 Tax=Halteromyces radiatus TaxID=101107 RepID=UPI0022201CF8|nr:Molybdopterin-synthase sulfurtransferase [Halteromyces radiatus]KAI8096313.1 Molybdopterin-synthase sulfurtransferase [Halteromyces radiatus]